MTPERAAAIFKELIEAPTSELNNFARRNGLAQNVDPQDFAQARELLRAIWVAFQSGPGPNWDRINTAWSAMHGAHGALPEHATVPQKPGWVRNVPPKPTLGDPAPRADIGQASASVQPYVAAASDQVIASQLAAKARQEQEEEEQRLAEEAARQSAPPKQSELHQRVREDIAVYAAFCAACAEYPNHVYQTQLQYGVGSPEARTQLDQDWQDRFDDDGQLFQTWEQYVAYYRQQLREQR